MNNYHIYQEQGRGKYSIVYKARRKKTLEFVAIKQTERSRRKKVLNEAKILTQLNTVTVHPNVIRFYDWVETKNHLWLITQYCPGGDLLTLIQQDKSLPEKTVRSFMRQVFMGLQFLHTNGVICADLKPAGILLNEYGNLKLADLGSARKLIDLMHSDKEPKKGTPLYMAPELFQDAGVYSFQSDFWAAGCVMYELAQGHPPFVSSTFADIVKLACTADTPRIENFSDQYNDLLMRLLAKDPQKRITWKELLKHPWIKPQLPEQQIPQQPHLQMYLDARKASSKHSKVDISKMSHNIKRNDENYSNNINAGVSRRDELDLGDDSEYAQYIQEDNDPQEALNMTVASPAPTSVNPFAKDKTKGRRTSLPQIDDSSNLNLQTEKITKNNLTPLDQLLSHQSDSVVKPIIGNKDIEQPQSFLYNKSSLGFSYIEPEDLIEGLTAGQMENQLKKIYDGMLGDNKVHVLGYFQTLIQNSQISNYLVKSNFVPLFLKLMKSYKQPVLRAKVCEILGLLIRHATVIEQDILKFKLTDTLIQVLKDKSEKVRRKAMAALGEFLFYGATQVDQNLEVWDMSSSCYSALVKTVKNTAEDEIVRFYACKTIQNITAQAKQVGIRFANMEIIISLLGLYSGSKLQLMRQSIVSCMHHIVLLADSLLQPILEKLGPKHISSMTESPETNPKSAQILLGLVNMYLSSTTTTKLARSLIEDETIIKGIMAAIDNSPNSVCKARAILFGFLISKANLRNIYYFQETKFFQNVEKLSKDGHKYFVQCLHHLIVLIQDNIGILIKYFEAGLAKKSDALNSKRNYGQVILSLLGCSLFQDAISTPTWLDQLFGLLDHCDTPLSGAQAHMIEVMRNTLMQILEKIVSNNRLIENLQEHIAVSIMPRLVQKIISKGSPADQTSETKFSCMKLLIYLCGFYLNEEYVFNSTVLGTTSKTISELLTEKFLPYVDFLLLEHREPIPSYTLKLLAVLFQLQPQFVRVFRKTGKIGCVLQNYDSSSNRLTQHTFKIVNSLCQVGDLPLNLYKQLLHKTKSILLHYLETHQTLFMEYPIQILQSILKSIAPQSRSKLETINAQDVEALTTLFQAMLPLQGMEDMVTREKATSLLKTLIMLGCVSSGGRWSIVDRGGLENYLTFLKQTGAQPKTYLVEKLKPTEDPVMHSMIKEVEALAH